MLGLLALWPLLVVYLSCFRRSLIDDAFITLQYASTLRHHLHWGFFPDAVTNTATSPLNVVLTALAGTVVPDMVDAAIWLASVEALVLAACLGLLSRRIFGNQYFGALAFLATIANPLLMSSIGLETLLYVTLMAAGLCLLVLRRWHALAACLALLTLTRPDGVLMFAALLVLAIPGADDSHALVRGTARHVVPSRPWWRGRPSFVLVYVLCLAPWYLFAWFHLGSLLPDTFFLKVRNPWGSLTFASGASLYVSRYPWPSLLSLSLVPFIPLCALRRGRDLPEVSQLMRVLGAFAVAYSAGYALLGPGPYHWYYAPLAIAGTWMGALALASQYARTAHRSALGRAALLATPAVAILGIAAHFHRAGTFVPTEAPIHTNWATHDRYREVGLWVRDHTDPRTKIGLQGEVGTLAFYSQRQLIEAFTCRGALEPLLRAYRTRGGIVGWLMRCNFFWLGRPPSCGTADDYLVGSPRPVDVAAIPGLVRSWHTSTTWIADGAILFAHR
ncbi:MAG: hypothetical protein U0587_08955 [Candidatus Binatia bacterium]